jgi:hypothetical protein
MYISKHITCLYELDAIAAPVIDTISRIKVNYLSKTGCPAITVGNKLTIYLLSNWNFLVLRNCTQSIIPFFLEPIQKVNYPI